MTGYRIPLSPAMRDAARESRTTIAAHVFARPVVRPLPPPALPAGETQVW